MRIYPVFVFTCLLAACGGPELKVIKSNASGHPGDVDVSLVGTPRIAWDADQGATAVSLTFVARMRDGTPLAPDNSTFSLLQGNRPLDPEIVQRNDAEARRVNVMYTLVLDATYSMLTHTPPAFEPMRAAAFSSVQQGDLKVAQSGRGAFAWQLFWFDDALYQPEGIWQMRDILAIPTPRHGAFTRLHGAVENALAASTPVLQAHAAKTPGAWQHVMVVFSDGADNHSWSPAAPHEEVLEAQPGLSYRKRAMERVAPEAVLTHIGEQDHFTLHAIGMGADVDQQKQLRAMAKAGHGTFQSDVTPETLNDVFARVTREFTTVQTAELRLPWAPGDYTLTVRVRAAESGKEGELPIRLHAGDSNARAL